MSEIILTTEIPREKGYIYFCGTTADGKLTMNKAKAGRVAKEKKSE